MAPPRTWVGEGLHQKLQGERLLLLGGLTFRRGRLLWARGSGRTDRPRGSCFFRCWPKGYTTTHTARLALEARSI